MSRIPATVPLYHDDSYLRHFDARVVAVAERAVALDRTAFYPGGGGQMPDHGALSLDGRRLEVASLRKENEVIWHELAPDAGELPAVGQPVAGEIDWDFRYRMMRTHTALHLLCGLIFSHYGAQVTGGQMYADRARMDFAMEGFSPALVGEIEGYVNQAIRENHPVRIYRLPRAEALTIPDLIRTRVNLLPPDIQEIRIVEIVGVDLQADGGTHVHETREVVGVRVIRTENKGKLNKRMEIALVDDELPDAEK